MKTIQFLPVFVLAMTATIASSDRPQPSPIPGERMPPPRTMATPVRSSPKPGQAATKNFSLLVVGNRSDNIVRFDLTTGEATVVAKLANGSRPRSLAVNRDGELFVALRGNKKNIVKLVPNRPAVADSPLVAVDVTRTIGRFGPGLMAFDHDGRLNVAGDTERAVLRFDVKTGKLIESMRLRSANLVGLTLCGDQVYAAEYFQKTILRFDLAAHPAQGSRFIYKAEQLDRPHGMTIGHNGNLYVSNLRNTMIGEFHRHSGEFVRTFVDTRRLGAGHVNDLHYASALDCYFLSSGDTVYELSRDGALLGRYQSDALSGAVAIAVQPRVIEAISQTKIRLEAGLIGRCTVAGEDTGLAFRYEHGKVLQPAILLGTAADPNRAGRGVRLVLRGRLQLARKANVTIWLAGGSSNGAHTTLRVGNKFFGPLGDDNPKSDKYAISLPPGDHSIVWTLTGGFFGCSMLKLQDSESSRLLPISFTRSDVEDFPTNKVIQISSDERGWPIPPDWKIGASSVIESF